MLIAPSVVYVAIIILSSQKRKEKRLIYHLNRKKESPAFFYRITAALFMICVLVFAGDSLLRPREM